MNKFITLALLAVCATMAHGQVYTTLPYGINGLSGINGLNLLNNQQSSSGSSSAAAAAAAASSSSSDSHNSGLIQSVSPTLISPVVGPSVVGPSLVGPSLVGSSLVGPSLVGPYVNSAPLITGPQLIPQGYASPVAAPLLQQYPLGLGLGVGPCGQGIISY